jgi:hypothetical protein
MFIITGICMTFIVGLFMSLCIVNTTEMRDGWKKNLVTIILALAIGFGISGLLCLEEQANAKVWNNGHCEECGGEWHLAGTTKSRNNGSTRYYWECEECNNLIDTTRNFR